MASAAQYDWVKRVLGFERVVETDTGPPLADMTARLTAIRDDMMLYGAAAELAGPLREAAVAAKGRSPDAGGLLDALEQRMAAIASAKRRAEAAALATASVTPGGLGLVGLAKLRLRLQDARGGFEEAIETLKASCEALLETNDFLNDPRSADPATLAAIAGLDRRVPAIGGLADEVQDAMDRMTGATDPAKRATEAQSVLAAIAAFRVRIDAEPLLREMEQTDAGSFAIHGTMVAVLDELADALRG